MVRVTNNWRLSGLFTGRILYKPRNDVILLLLLLLLRSRRSYNEKYITTGEEDTADSIGRITSVDIFIIIYFVFHTIHRVVFSFPMARVHLTQTNG